MAGGLVLHAPTPLACNGRMTGTELYWFDRLRDDGEPDGRAVLLDTFEEVTESIQCARECRNWIMHRYGPGDLVIRPRGSDEPEDSELVLTLGEAPEDTMFAGPARDVAPTGTDGRPVSTEGV